MYGPNAYILFWQWREIYSLWYIWACLLRANSRSAKKPNQGVYASIQQCRWGTQGIFYLLCGAEILNSRNEGALHVGEVSYGKQQYVCFIRNNIVIRIVYTTVEQAVAETFIMQVDRQIVDEAK